MDFYQALSRHYDAIFAVDEAEMRFIRELVPEGASVLDLGCGTGNKTVHIAETAGQVEAVDLEWGMVERARRDNARPNVHYSGLDMRELGKAFAGRSFDAALCLGNTLVHLPSPATILGLLHTVHGLLAPDGVCIIQILNYDRILDRNIEELPLLETPGALFRRRYIRRDGLLRFVTALEDKETGEVQRGDIALYPLRKQELTDLCARAGFGPPEYYGNYRGEAHTSDSFVTIAYCRKA